MTQDEYNAAQSAGKVSRLEDIGIEGDPAAPEPVADQDHPAYSLENFLPILVNLITPRKPLTSAPTFTPKTLVDSLQFVDDGANRWLYLYMNGAWRSAPLSVTSVSQLIAGTGISISPPGGTGAVTVSSTVSMEAGTTYFLLPANTNTDTVGSVIFPFVPKMVIGTARYNSSNAWAWGIYVNGAGGTGENIAALPGSASGPISQTSSSFLGLATGTPGTYVRNLSVSGGTISFHYGNSGTADVDVEFWAVG